MANCCCDRFTINEVSEISPGVYQGTVPTECLICECKTAPFEVDIYTDAGVYLNNGILLACVAGIGQATVTIVCADPILETYQFDIIDMDCSESISPSLGSLSMSSLSLSQSTPCCDFATIISIGFDGSNFFYETSPDYDFCSCLGDKVDFYDNLNNFLGTGSVIDCTESSGTYRITSDWSAAGNEAYMKPGYCDDESQSISSMSLPSMSMSESLPSVSMSSISLPSSSVSSMSLPSISASSFSINSFSVSSFSINSQSINSQSMASISISSISSCSGSTIDSFTIVKDDCYKYTITSELCNIYKVTVTNYVTNEIAEDKNGVVLDGVYKVTGAQIIFPSEDAIYKVELSCDGICGTQCFILYELCSLQRCYLNLLDYLMCHEQDPCCDPCNVEEQMKLQKYRFELDKLNGFMLQLFGYLHADKIDFPMGFGEINADRELYLAKIKDLFEKIQEVVTRCGCKTLSTTKCGKK
jgi:hypothetical protein